MTHSDLILLAAKWLRQKHEIVVTEMSSGAGEEPDAIGFKSGHSTLVECKVSRSDFIADGNKIYRQLPENGLGTLRYYCCPKGLIKKEELPTGWGLLEVNNGKLRATIKAEHSPKTNYRKEMSILFSVIRRIGQSAPNGISVKCYQFDNKRRATIGILKKEYFYPSREKIKE